MGAIDGRGGTPRRLAGGTGRCQDLAVRTRVNGRTVQDGNTSSMIFGVAQTIAFLSRS